MLEYSISFARSARKELDALDPSVAIRVLGKIEGLGTNPRPVGVVKIEGTESLWRIRVGDWRVIYQIFDREHDRYSSRTPSWRRISSINALE